MQKILYGENKQPQIIKYLMQSILYDGNKQLQIIKYLIYTIWSLGNAHFQIIKYLVYTILSGSNKQQQLIKYIHTVDVKPADMFMASSFRALPLNLFKGRALFPSSCGFSLCSDIYFWFSPQAVCYRLEGLPFCEVYHSVVK